MKSKNILSFILSLIIMPLYVLLCALEFLCDSFVVKKVVEIIFGPSPDEDCDSRVGGHELLGRLGIIVILSLAIGLSDAGYDLLDLSKIEPDKDLFQCISKIFIELTVARMILCKPIDIIKSIYKDFVVVPVSMMFIDQNNYIYKE